MILAITLWNEKYHKKISQGLIIRHSKLDKMTVSKSLKKLVMDGYIKRIENQHDTRAKLVHLTTKGQSIAAKLVPLVEKIDKHFFGTLKKTEQQLLIHSLNNLVSKNENF